MFDSENGACGPSGLFFVIFKDNSCYAYSTFYKKADISLIKDILEHVPELKTVVYFDGKLNYKRERSKEEFDQIYIGLGNHAVMTDELCDEINNRENESYFASLKAIMKNHFDVDLNEVWKLVKESLDG